MMIEPKKLKEISRLFTPDCWWSFFCNESGECWVYVLDLATDQRWIGGDETDWENSLELKDHPIAVWSIGERAWLLACDIAAQDVRALYQGHVSRGTDDREG